MHQRGRLFVLMVTELPTVMNSRDDAPRAASIAHSHRRWMEIGPGGEAKEVHTRLRLLWTHMDAGISAHAHTERESEGECVCVGEWVYWHLWMLTAHWAEDDLLMGDSMEHIEGEICLGGFSVVLVQKNSWMSATSPHVLSWCSLQLETSPMHTPYQTWLQHFLSCFIITWMVAILLYTVWLLLASQSKSLAWTWWANNSHRRRNFCFSGWKSS